MSRYGKMLPFKFGLCIFWVILKKSDSLSGMQLEHKFMVITHENALSFGRTYFWDDCPLNTLANGFEVKTDREEKNFSDEEGMTGIRLFCSDQSGIERKVIGSYSLPTGKWKGRSTCPEGEWINGFRIRVQEAGGWVRDDTAANDVDMVCNTSHSYSGRGNHRGTWSNWIYCPSGQAICGVQTQVEDAFTADRVGLVAMYIRCCDFSFNGSYVEEGNRSSVDDILFPPESNSFPLPTPALNSSSETNSTSTNTFRENDQNVNRNRNKNSSIPVFENSQRNNTGNSGFTTPSTLKSNKSFSYDPANSNSRNGSNGTGIIFNNRSTISPGVEKGSTSSYWSNNSGNENPSGSDTIYENDLPYGPDSIFFNNLSTTPDYINPNNINIFIRDFALSVNETGTTAADPKDTRDSRKFAYDKVFNNSGDSIWEILSNRNKSISNIIPNEKDKNISNPFNPPKEKGINTFNDSRKNIWETSSIPNTLLDIIPKENNTNILSPFNPYNDPFDLNSTKTKDNEGNSFNDSGHNIWKNSSNKNRSLSDFMPKDNNTHILSPFNPFIDPFDFNSTTPTDNEANNWETSLNNNRSLSDIMPKDNNTHILSPFNPFNDPFELNSTKSTIDEANSLNNSSHNIWETSSNHNRSLSDIKPNIPNIFKPYNNTSNTNEFNSTLYNDTQINRFNDSNIHIWETSTYHNRSLSDIVPKNISTSFNPYSNNRKPHDYNSTIIKENESNSTKNGTERYIPFGIIPVSPPTPSFTYRGKNSSDIDNGSITSLDNDSTSNISKPFYSTNKTSTEDYIPFGLIHVRPHTPSFKSKGENSSDIYNGSITSLDNGSTSNISKPFYSTNKTSTEDYMPFGLIPVMIPTPSLPWFEENSTYSGNNSISSPTNENNSFNSFSGEMPGYNKTSNKKISTGRPNSYNQSIVHHPSSSDTNTNQTNDDDYFPFVLVPFFVRSGPSNKTTDRKSNEFGNTFKGASGNNSTNNNFNNTIFLNDDKFRNNNATNDEQLTTPKIISKRPNRIFFIIEQNNSNSGNNEIPQYDDSNLSNNSFSTTPIPHFNPIYPNFSGDKNYENNSSTNLSGNDKELSYNKTRPTNFPINQSSTTATIPKRTNKIYFIIQSNKNTSNSGNDTNNDIANKRFSTTSSPNSNQTRPTGEKDKPNIFTKVPGSGFEFPYKNRQNSTSSINPKATDKVFYDNDQNDNVNNSKKYGDDFIPQNNDTYYDLPWPWPWTTASTNTTTNNNDALAGLPFSNSTKIPKVTKSIFVFVHQANRSKTTGKDENLPHDQGATNEFSNKPRLTTPSINDKSTDSIYLVTEPNNDTFYGRTPITNNYIPNKPKIFPTNTDDKKTEGEGKDVNVNNDNYDDYYQFNSNGSIGGSDFYDLKGRGNTNTAKVNRGDNDFFKSHNGPKNRTDPNLATFVMLGLAVTAAVILSVIGIGYIIKKKRLYKRKIAVDPSYKYVISIRHVRPIDPITCE